MSDAFSNRPPAASSGEQRASIDRMIAELDRKMALPAGHPEVLRAFEHGRRRLIVPSSMTTEQVDELIELARQGLVSEGGEP